MAAAIGAAATIWVAERPKDIPAPVKQTVRLQEPEPTASQQPVHAPTISRSPLPDPTPSNGTPPMLEFPTWKAHLNPSDVQRIKLSDDQQALLGTLPIQTPVAVTERLRSEIERFPPMVSTARSIKLRSGILLRQLSNPISSECHIEFDDISHWRSREHWTIPLRRIEIQPGITAALDDYVGGRMYWFDLYGGEVRGNKGQRWVSIDAMDRASLKNLKDWFAIAQATCYDEK